MRKIYAILLCLALVICTVQTARAVRLGKYQWGIRNLDCVEAGSDSVVALEGINPDEQAVLVSFRVSDGLWVSRGRMRAMYGQLRLEGRDGTLYPALAALRSGSEPVLSFIFAIPLDVPLDSLELSFPPDGAEGLPEGLLGDWYGAAGGISLRLAISPDGSGAFMFKESSGNERYYDASFYSKNAVFLVDVFNGDALGITRCGGTYAYADGVLTLYVQTVYEDGRRVESSVPFIRDLKVSDAAPAEGLQGEGDALLFAGEWQGQDDTMRYVFTFQADGGFTGLGCRIGETGVAFSNNGTWQAVGNELRITYEGQTVMKAAYKMTAVGLILTADGETILFIKTH